MLSYFTGPNSLPKASITPSSFTTEEGKRADFHCQISGDEKLHVRWIKRNGRLPESAVIIGNRLEIEKTSLHDQGVYACTVTNRYGQAEARTRLTVKKGTYIHTYVRTCMRAYVRACVRARVRACVIKI